MIMSKKINVCFGDTSSFCCPSRRCCRICCCEKPRLYLNHNLNSNILPVSAFLAQIDKHGRQTGEECDVTSVFRDVCEAKVRCRFTQAEYRDRARDVCQDDSYNESQLIFMYSCLPGA